MKRNVLASESDSEEEAKPVKQPKRVKKLFIPDPIDTSCPNGNDSSMDSHTTKDMPPTRTSTRCSSETENNLEPNDDYMRYEVPEDDDLTPASVNKSLFTQNKPSIGLSIMQKMGFQVGQTLGRNAENSTSFDSNKLLEPISVQFKRDKLGLGAEAKDSPKFNAFKEIDFGKYRTILQEIKSKHHNETILIKLMKTAYEVSEQKEDEKMHESNSYLWNQYLQQLEIQEKEKRYKSSIIRIEAQDSGNDNNDDYGDHKNKMVKEDEAEMSIEEKILRLLLFLRSYNYCFFCGCYYNDTNEMQLICPGVSEKSHQQ